MYPKQVGSFPHYDKIRQRLNVPDRQPVHKRRLMLTAEKMGVSLLSEGVYECDFFVTSGYTIYKFIKI